MFLTTCCQSDHGSENEYYFFHLRLVWFSFIIKSEYLVIGCEPILLSQDKHHHASEEGLLSSGFHRNNPSALTNAHSSARSGGDGSYTVI